MWVRKGRRSFSKSKVSEQKTHLTVQAAVLSRSVPELLVNTDVPCEIEIGFVIEVEMEKQNFETLGLPMWIDKGEGGSRM